MWRWLCTGRNKRPCDMEQSLLPTYLIPYSCFYLFFLSCDVAGVTGNPPPSSFTMVQRYQALHDPHRVGKAIGSPTTKTRFRAYAILEALVCSVWKTGIDDSWSQHRNGTLSGIRLEGCQEISLWLQHRTRWRNLSQRHSWGHVYNSVRHLYTAVSTQYIHRL